MQTKPIIIVTYFILSLIISSCSNKKVEAIMQRVDSLLETNPDSAFVMLDSLVYSGKVNLENNPEFLLLYIQAKDKADKDISEDIDMLEVAKYFEEKGNPEKTALAYFYAGRIYKYQQKFKKAVQYCTKSLQYAQQTTNYNLLGLIHFDLGEIYSEELNIPEAKKNYLLARDYFIKAGNEKNGEYIYGYIGSMYLYEEPQQPDSALVCYEKVLKKAFKEKDSSKIADINRLQASIYQEKKEYHKSKEFILKSFRYDNTNKVTNVVMSQICLSSNQLDSALYYANKGYELNKNTNDKYVLCAIHSLYADIYKEKKNFELALNHHEQMYSYADSIYENNQRQSILEIQKKYEQSELQKKYDKERINKLTFLNVSIIVLFVSFIIILFMVLIYRNKNKIIKDNQRMIETLDRMLSEKPVENKNDVRNFMLKNIQDIRNTIQKEKNEIVTQKISNKEYQKRLGRLLDWDKFYVITDEVYDNFYRKIKEKCDFLNQKELKLCCLLRAGFLSDEICFILSYKTDSFYVMKSKLKQKLNSTLSSDLTDFLK